MEQNTINSNTTPAAEPVQQAATFTQADVDRIVADRLERERRKYADYDDLKRAGAELSALKAGNNAELEKLKADLAAARSASDEAQAAMKAMKTDALKVKLCAEAGIPAELATRVQGSDEDAIKADIEALKAVLPGARPVGGSGAPVSGNAAGTSLGDLYADALRKGDIALAMMYKRQMYETNQ